jgi:hypothetical protein
MGGAGGARTVSRGKWAALLAVCASAVLSGCGGYGLDPRPETEGQQAAAARATRKSGVADYLRGVMAIKGIEEYIIRAYQSTPGGSLVYVDFRSDVPDWAIEKFVRSITEGVHNASESGMADVVAQVRGITVAKGSYSIWHGSIEVKMLR